MKKQVYRWTTKDKWRYGFSLIPFLIASLGAAYFIGTISIYLTLIFLGLYLVGNVFQAGACTGCPYRGRYCPPLFGVYLGNILSGILYKNRELDLKRIKLHGETAELVMYGMFLFPVYWLSTLGWYFPVVYSALLLMHLALFMPTQCEKCSYIGVIHFPVTGETIYAGGGLGCWFKADDATPVQIRVGSKVGFKEAVVARATFHNATCLRITPRITRLGDDTNTVLRLYCKCTRQPMR